MNASPRSRDRTRHVQPIRHDGPCGIRLECWLQRCRGRFAPYRSIELLVDRDGDPKLVIAYCHRERLRPWELPIGLGLLLETRAAA